jgi:Zn-finger nucleic acid-binding protein
MRCPICKETYRLMSNRKRVEMDSCPRCSGVGLDRGEPDRIIEGTIHNQCQPSLPSRPQPQSSSPSQSNPKHPDGGPHRKKVSWLGDILG